MADSIVKQINYSALIEQWYEQEKAGVEFPVPFDTAWHIAGYSRKSDAKKNLRGLQEGLDFCGNLLKSTGGRRSRVFHLSLDAFKDFCLLAGTPEGKEIRRYFIECEKKWRKVQNVAPAFAQEIELQHLKNEEAALQLSLIQAQTQLIDKRHAIVQICPEAIQQKILGYTEVHRIEYRDRQFMDGDLINDGSTMTQAEAMDRLGIKRSELKKLYDLLPDDAFESQPNIVCNRQLRRDYFAQLQELFIGKAQRQRYLGE